MESFSSVRRFSLQSPLHARLVRSDESSVAQPRTVLRIEPNPLDFGAVGPMEARLGAFELINDGDAPVRIVDAYVSCGCTSLNIPQAVIPGHGRLRSTLMIQPGELRGDIEKIAIVRYCPDELEASVVAEEILTIRCQVTDTGA